MNAKRSEKIAAEIARINALSPAEQAREQLVMVTARRDKLLSYIRENEDDLNEMRVRVRYG
jgi:hypothetical protein